MIISHRHRFIFIKNRKVAGTSVEKALHAICGPEDVLTPDHLFQGEEDVLAATARHWDGRFNPARELLQCRSAVEAGRVLRDAYKRPKFYNHMRGSSVMARIPRKVWDGYYKFCFERNSWDKVTSSYFWKQRQRDTWDSLSDYILDKPNRPVRAARRRTADQRLPTDWERYTLHDRMIVDDVYDYADLAGGLDRALEKAGVDAATRAAIELPRLKGNLRKDSPELTPEADALLREVFAREIAHFGFTPQG